MKFALNLFERISRKLRRMRMYSGGLRVLLEPRTMQESYILNQDTRRLLVLGLSRTGTSLLQRLLNAHPKVFVTYESAYRPYFDDNSWPNLHAYYYEILKQHRHLCRSLSMESSPSAVKLASYEEKYAYFGDKGIYDPSPKFRKRLKRAIDSKTIDKVIFLMRDPRARTLSYLNWKQRSQVVYEHSAQLLQFKLEEMDQQQLIIRESQIWRQYAADVHRYTAGSSRCIYLKYEDLVTSPTVRIHDILSFLDLDRAEYAGAHLATVETGSLDRWRAEFDERAVARITQLTMPLLEKFQYV